MMVLNYGKVVETMKKIRLIAAVCVVALMLTACAGVSKETTLPTVETTVPVTTIPATTVPETTVPETTVPETTVPETTVPMETVEIPEAPETITAESWQKNHLNAWDNEVYGIEDGAAAAERPVLGSRYKRQPDQNRNLPGYSGACTGNCVVCGH